MYNIYCYIYIHIYTYIQEYVWGWCWWSLTFAAAAFLVLPQTLWFLLVQTFLQIPQELKTTSERPFLNRTFFLLLFSYSPYKVHRYLLTWSFKKKKFFWDYICSLWQYSFFENVLKFGFFCLLASIWLKNLISLFCLEIVTKLGKLIDLYLLLLSNL